MVTAEKKHGCIGELIRSNDKPLFIFWVENDAQIRRFNEFVLAENPQKLFEIIKASQVLKPLPNMGQQDFQQLYLI